MSCHSKILVFVALSHIFFPLLFKNEESSWFYNKRGLFRRIYLDSRVIHKMLFPAKLLFSQLSPDKAIHPLLHLDEVTGEGRAVANPNKNNDIRIYIMISNNNDNIHTIHLLTAVTLNLYCRPGRQGTLRVLSLVWPHAHQEFFSLSIFSS